MMKVLLIKMSSLGDVIHTLPALTDAQVATGGAAKFDWVIEENYRQVAAWHPAVGRTIVVALRRWKKELGFKAAGELKNYLIELRKEVYDCVIDAQGLLKSAVLGTLAARGTVHGFDKSCARETAASFFYGRGHEVSRDQHAVTRSRQLMAGALGYPPPTTEPDYGLDTVNTNRDRRAILVPHASVERKHWELNNWIELGRKFVDNGIAVDITWGNDQELSRAKQIAAKCGGQPTAQLDLAGLAALFRTGSVMVSLDTGLSHLAAALALPNVCICVASDPRLSGAFGKFQLAVDATKVNGAEQIYALAHEQLTLASTAK